MIYECEAALHALVALRDKPFILVTRPAGLSLDGVWRAYGEITRRNIGAWTWYGGDRQKVNIHHASCVPMPLHEAVQNIYWRVNIDPHTQHIIVEEYHHERNLQP